MSDQSIRQQALDTNQSFIVQAPAGSGKTELLTQRYLALLAKVTQPEQVLAMTFTQKAAQEMRARVQKALHTAEHTPAPESDHYAYQTWTLAKAVLMQDAAQQWHLLQQPQRLNITTIDGFCHRLVSQSALACDLPQGWTLAILPERLYETAVLQLLADHATEAPWQKALLQLLTHVDNRIDRFVQLLSSLLARREQWLPVVTQAYSEKDLRARLERTLLGICQQALADLQATIPETCRNRLWTLARCLPHVPKNFAEDAMESWLWLADLLMTKEGGWRKQLTRQQGFLPKTELPKTEQAYWLDLKAQLQATIAELAELEGVQGYWQKLRDLPSLFYEEAQWLLVSALLQLLPIAVAYLQVTMQSRGEVDYVEITVRALQILQDLESTTDLRLQLDYRLHHILVDEFQDTSQAQFRLLECLTEGWQVGDGRSLFLVGDPMQSIYRFRQADVGLFLRASRQGIGTVPLTPLSLTRNFRSDVNLIAWLNASFMHIMPRTEDVFTGAIAYKSSVATQSYGDSGGIQSHLAGSRDKEARGLVAQIQTWRQQDSQASVAVLVRSRTVLPSLLAALRAAKIPFLAQEVETLAEQPVVQDLLSLLMALLRLGDRVSWLAVLRAPWCGLDLADLLKLSQASLETTLWSICEESAVSKQLSTAGRQRLQRIKPIIAEALAIRWRVPLASWLEQTWLQLGGPACLRHESELSFAQTFFQLLTELSHLPLEELLATLQQCVAKQRASEPEQIGAIQIMTVHRAKGLEFDHVIVLGLDAKTRASDQPLLRWQALLNAARQPEIIIAPMQRAGAEADKIYRYLQLQEKAQEDYEQRRLLYVALTRAKKTLLISGVVKADKAGELTVSEQSLLGILWPYLPKGTMQQPAMEASASDDVVEDYSWRSLLPTQWQPKQPLPKWPEMSQTLATVEGQQPYQQKQNRVLGTLLHEALAMVVLQKAQDPMVWLLSQKAFFYQRIQVLAGDESLWQMLQHAFNNMMHDSIGQWLLAPKTDDYVELPLSTVVDGSYQVHIIDRTFQEGNVRWIIDYKSAVPAAGQSLAAFAVEQKDLYEGQLRLYQRVLQAYDKSSKQVALGLYFPLVPYWLCLAQCSG